MNGRNKNFAVMLMAALLAIFLGATPAFAAHKDGHTKGTKADKTTASAKGDKADSGYTEDNDTNDGNTANNVEDEGDNAHPSGKDRSTENGGSGNQGNSGSDPDDDGRGPDRSNGGPDKPNGSGGVDLADQDGNNGCGNDDDFEDDNEGWCGKPADKGKPDTVKANDNKPCDADATMPGTQKCEEEDEVAAEEIPCDADATMPGTQACETDKNGNVTICHATGSATNPFVELTISVNGLNGHADHEGDIIPMPADGVCGAVEGAEVLPDEEPEVDVDGDNVCPAEETMVEGADGETECLTDDEVLGLLIDNAVGGGSSPSKRGPSVLGIQVAAEESGAVLPFTGGDVFGLLAVGLGMVALGLFAAKGRKTASDKG